MADDGWIMVKNWTIWTCGDMRGAGKATGQTRAKSQMMIFWREFWHLIMVLVKQCDFLHEEIFDLLEEFETWPNFVEAVSDAQAAGDNFEGGDQQL